MLWRSRIAEMPSTSAWWSLAYIATRPSRSPSIRCHSHSGRSVARRVECSREHELEQLADAARLRQCAVAHVVLDVELVVLAPDVLTAGADRPHRVLEEQRRDVVRLRGAARTGRGRSCGRRPRACGTAADPRRASASAGSPPSGSAAAVGSRGCTMRSILVAWRRGRTRRRSGPGRIEAHAGPPARGRLGAESDVAVDPTRPVAHQAVGGRAVRGRGRRRVVVASEVFGHTAPFFAPVAAVVSLGTSYGQRLRRVAEVTVGVALGVFGADLLVRCSAPGGWLITLVVGLAMSAALLLDNGQVFLIQAAVQSIVITALTPAPGAGVHPLDRRADRRRRGPGGGDGRPGGSAAAAARAGGEGACGRSRDLLQAAERRDGRRRRRPGDRAARRGARDRSR